MSPLPLLPPDKLGSYEKEEEEEEVSDSEQVIQAPTVLPLHDFTSIGFLESHAMRRNHNNHHHHRHQTFVEFLNFSNVCIKIYFDYVFKH